VTCSKDQDSLRKLIHCQPMYHISFSLSSIVQSITNKVRRAHCNLNKTSLQRVAASPRQRFSIDLILVSFLHLICSLFSCILNVITNVLASMIFSHAIGNQELCMIFECTVMFQSNISTETYCTQNKFSIW
jgi:hypothetical protein